MYRYIKAGVSRSGIGRLGGCLAWAEGGEAMMGSLQVVCGASRRGAELSWNGFVRRCWCVGARPCRTGADEGCTPW